MTLRMASEISLYCDTTGAVPNCSTVAPRAPVPLGSTAVIASATRAAVVVISVRSELSPFSEPLLTATMTAARATSANTPAAMDTSTKLVRVERLGLRVSGVSSTSGSVSASVVGTGDPSHGGGSGEQEPGQPDQCGASGGGQLCRQRAGFRRRGRQRLL